MNKFLFSLFLLLAVPLSFVSCSDDEEYVYVPDSVDLIIQKLQSETYNTVAIYKGSTLLISGPKSIIKGFEKPFMMVDCSQAGQNTSYYYLDLTKLQYINFYDDPLQSKHLMIKFY